MNDDNDTYELLNERQNEQARCRAYHRAPAWNDPEHPEDDDEISE